MLPKLMRRRAALVCLLATSFIGACDPKSPDTPRAVTVSPVTPKQRAATTRDSVSAATPLGALPTPREGADTPIIELNRTVPIATTTPKDATSNVAAPSPTPRTRARRASDAQSATAAASNSIDDLLSGSLRGSGGSASPTGSSTGIVGLSGLGRSGGGGGLGIAGVGYGGAGRGSGAIGLGSGLGFGSGARHAQPFNTDSYARVEDTGFVNVSDQPVSTFSIDVDTASYSIVRRYLRDGSLPPVDAVRVEEMLNYFRYSYAPPADDKPFALHTEIADAPWNPAHRLLLVGLQARPIEQAQTPPRNLVFLVDVSGSMQSADKLPLLKRGLSLLATQLREQDRIAIVVYAGASGVALPTTHGADQAAILAALDGLEAGGSTNGAEGIELAYQIATRNFIRGGVNRVVLATDGDFNVGVTSVGDLTRLIERKRASGVFLSVLGFGTGNLKDETMEQLADRGNGNYAYIDSLAEAQRALVTEGGATLVTVAQDVKLQIEMNPQRVRGYRLIGYENRRLATQDFNDDKKDAGEMGAGHSVTALYEVIPQDSDEPLNARVDPLRYQASATVDANHDDELALIKVRYKAPNTAQSVRFDTVVNDQTTLLEHTSNDFRFAAAVASLGMVLSQSAHRGSATYNSVIALASGVRDQRRAADQQEILELARRAQSLTAQVSSN